jgi:hypothetical protein
VKSPTSEHVSKLVSNLGFQIIVFTTVIYAVVEGNAIAIVFLKLYCGLVAVTIINSIHNEWMVHYVKAKTGEVYIDPSVIPEESEPRIQFITRYINLVFSAVEITIFFYYEHWVYLTLWVLAELTQIIYRQNQQRRKNCN